LAVSSVAKLGFEQPIQKGMTELGKYECKSLSTSQHYAVPFSYCFAITLIVSCTLLAAVYFALLITVTELCLTWTWGIDAIVAVGILNRKIYPFAVPDF
jgi:hypothetical protein